MRGKFDRSGWQRDKRSGRGFPKSSFIPCVTMKAVASESASPIQAVFHSHTFLLNMREVGVPFLAVGPGTKTKQTMKVMAAGMTRATTTSSHVGMVSSFSKGYDIERSTGEKGRWKGFINSHPAPTAAIALCKVSTIRYHNCADAHVRQYLGACVPKTVHQQARFQANILYEMDLADSHYYYPVKDV